MPIKLLILALFTFLSSSSIAIDGPLGMPMDAKLKELRVWLNSKPIISPNAPIPQYTAAQHQLFFSLMPSETLGQCRRVCRKWNNYILAMPGWKYYRLEKSTIEEEKKGLPVFDREVFGQFELPCIHPITPVTLNLLAIESAVDMGQILRGIVRSHRVKLVIISSSQSIVNIVSDINKEFGKDQRFLISFPPEFWTEQIIVSHNKYLFGNRPEPWPGAWYEPSPPTGDFSTVLRVPHIPKIGIYVLLRNIAFDRLKALALFAWFKKTQCNPGILGALTHVCHTTNSTRVVSLLETLDGIGIQDRTSVAKQAAKFVKYAPDLNVEVLLKKLVTLNPKVRELVANDATSIFAYDSRIPVTEFLTVSAHLLDVIASHEKLLEGVDVAGFLYYFRLLFLYGIKPAGRIPILNKGLTQTKNFTTKSIDRAKSYLSLVTAIDPLRSPRVYAALESLCLKFDRPNEDRIVLELKLYFGRCEKDASLEDKLKKMDAIRRSDSLLAGIRRTLCNSK